MKTEQTNFSETWAYKIQTPGNYPEEIIQNTEHGDSLKSKNPRLVNKFLQFFFRGEGDYS